MLSRGPRAILAPHTRIAVRSMGHAPKSMEDAANAFYTKFLPKGWVEKFRQLMLFKPDDIHNLHQNPDPLMKMPGVPRIQGYRYPAPGSRPVARIPAHPSADHVFDTKYYSRDTKRNLPSGNLTILPPKLALEQGLPEIFDASVLQVPGGETMSQGSPGNKNPAVLKYDKTGLRSAMSATHEELQKALAAELPDHLPYYPWEKDLAKHEAIWAAKGIPPQAGVPFKWKVPKIARRATW